jgi:hypothetical protein
VTTLFTNVPAGHRLASQAESDDSRQVENQTSQEVRVLFAVKICSSSTACHTNPLVTADQESEQKVA